MQDCVRKAVNLTQKLDFWRWESASKWDPEKVKETIPIISPKLDALLRNIQQLDQQDYETTGKNYKHVIISTMKPSNYGVKAVIAALSAHSLIDPTATPLPLLTTSDVFSKPPSTRAQRRLISEFNSRPENTYGQKIRFIVIDGSFQEGLDLFDVKYMHMMEPQPFFDQKQTIGRATRFCGQLGLERNPATLAWDLHVFRYEITMRIPEISSTTITASELLEYMDPKEANLSKQYEAAERLCQEAAVDRLLTTQTASTQKGGRNPNPKQGAVMGSRYVPKGDTLNLHCSELQSWVYDRFQRLKGANKAIWGRAPASQLDTACKFNPQASPTLNPTQNFLRLYYTPENAYKGMLLFHSVGSGKTCSAIATTASFVKKGYTVLWVTRHTLKKEMYKNIFDTVCYGPFRRTKKVLAGVRAIKDDPDAQRERLAENNFLNPISYRQFTNFLNGRNKELRRILEARNGQEDPLQKTLIIIDEAHRLVDNSLPLPERPDPAVFHRQLQHSYGTSQNNSARVLLLTATPFKRSPYDLVSLMNLIGTSSEQIPLDTPIHEVTLDQVKGRISYLDRSQDSAHFAQPILSTIDVPASTPLIKENQEMIRIQKERLELVAQHKMFTDELRNYIAAEERRGQAILEKYAKTINWGDPDAREDALRRRSEIIQRLSDSMKEHVESAKQQVAAFREQLQSLQTKYQRAEKQLEKQLMDDPSTTAALKRCILHRPSGVTLATPAATPAPSKYEVQYRTKDE